LPLIWLPRLGAFSCKVARTPTIKATICIARTSWLLSNRPWTSLLSHRGSCNALLLWGPENPTPLLRGLLRSFRSSVLHQMIPLWRSTRGSCWCLPFLFGLVNHDAIFLSDGQVNQIIISAYLDSVQAVHELGTKASMETITLLSIGVNLIPRILKKVIESLTYWSMVRVP
jgi:hypothetical protein